MLLKNEENVLPFNKKKIAVISPNAKIATYCGGGSTALNAYEAVTPFDGISNSAQAGVELPRESTTIICCHCWASDPRPWMQLRDAMSPSTAAGSLNLKHPWR